MITIPFLPEYPILLSDRRDGSFRTEQEVTTWLKDQQPKEHTAYLHIGHGSQRVHWKPNEPNPIADAIITDNPNTCVSMIVGDCFPIILIEPRKGIIAMIHGGWRSLVSNIIPLTIKELKYFHYGVKPENLIAWIGPGIRAESNVFTEPPILDTFPEWKEYVNQLDSSYSVDLVKYIQESLAATNIPGENIFDYGKDTYPEKETFFSHRRAMLEDDEDGRFIVAVYKNS